MNIAESIFYGEFPKSVLEQADSARRLSISAQLSRRLDFRGKAIFAFTETVDTPTSCAYSLYPTQDGWKLGIHVADVCEYACENSPLDTEARKRRASVATYAMRSDMLPPEIVYELCNLAKDGDKLAISIMIELDSALNIQDITVDESVVHICGRCLYNEIDQLREAKNRSSVMLLANKYAPYADVIDNMYMLSEQLRAKRAARGGLDCIRFNRIYVRNDNQQITDFIRESEPTSRAMLREICYFAAEAVGKYTIAHKLPCIFNGRASVPQDMLKYLCNLIGEQYTEESPALLTARIAEKAKKSPYYGFVCDAIANNIPRAVYSTEPSPNAFCGCDHIVSFFNPTIRYTDLVIQRVLKAAIQAGDAKNLIPSKHKKLMDAATVEANSAEMFLHKAYRQFATTDALEYLKNNYGGLFVGFPVFTNTNGEVIVYLECGLQAVIPVEYATDYKYRTAQPERFEIISVGTNNTDTTVRPVFN